MSKLTKSNIGGENSNPYTINITPWSKEVIDSCLALKSFSEKRKIEISQQSPAKVGKRGLLLISLLLLLLFLFLLLLLLLLLLFLIYPL